MIFDFCILLGTFVVYAFKTVYTTIKHTVLFTSFLVALQTYYTYSYKYKYENFTLYPERYIKIATQHSLIETLSVYLKSASFNQLYILLSKSSLKKKIFLIVVNFLAISFTVILNVSFLLCKLVKNVYLLQKVNSFELYLQHYWTKNIDSRLIVLVNKEWMVNGKDKQVFNTVENAFNLIKNWSTVSSLNTFKKNTVEVLHELKKTVIIEKEKGPSYSNKRHLTFSGMLINDNKKAYLTDKSKADTNNNYGLEVVVDNVEHSTLLKRSIILSASKKLFHASDSKFDSVQQNKNLIMLAAQDFKNSSLTNDIFNSKTLKLKTFQEGIIEKINKCDESPELKKMIIDMIKNNQASFDDF